MKCHLGEHPMRLVGRKWPIDIVQWASQNGNSAISCFDARRPIMQGQHGNIPTASRQSFGNQSDGFLGAPHNIRRVQCREDQDLHARASYEVEGRISGRQLLLEQWLRSSLAKRVSSIMNLRMAI